MMIDTSKTTETPKKTKNKEKKSTNPVGNNSDQEVEDSQSNAVVVVTLKKKTVQIVLFLYSTKIWVQKSTNNRYLYFFVPKTSNFHCGNRESTKKVQTLIKCVLFCTIKK